MSKVKVWLKQFKEKSDPIADSALKWFVALEYTGAVLAVLVAVLAVALFICWAK